MLLFDILSKHVPEIAPAKTKLHLATWNGDENPLDVFFAGQFERWQSWQSQKNFERPLIVSLIKLGNDRWLFVGCYRRLDCAWVDEPKPPHWSYSTAQVLTGLEGRLVINLQRTGREPYRFAEKLAPELVLQGILADSLTRSSLDAGNVERACSEGTVAHSLTDLEKVEEQQDQEESADADERARARRRGQGFSSDPEFNRVVELRGMVLALAHYESAGWTVMDTSANHPYDLRCTRDDEIRYVEVKGTTGDGSVVTVTYNEVEHVRKHSGQCDLFIVLGVEVQRDEGGVLVADGGTERLVSPWAPDAQGLLKPISYRYTLP